MQMLKQIYSPISEDTLKLGASLITFPPPLFVLSPLCLVQDGRVVSAAWYQLAALILGACGVWCAKFVIYS